MSYDWKFSHDSKPLLQKCLNAAVSASPDDSNKWLKRFGPRNLELEKKINNTIVIQDTPEDDIIVAPQENQDDLLKILDELQDLDLDIVSKFHQLSKLQDKPKLLLKLGETLPTDTITKLTQYIFDTANVDNKFLQKFYEHFLPVYIRRENSRCCTELLLKSYKQHTHCFKILLKMVMKDVNIQSSILNDFMSSLETGQVADLINDITDIGLSGEEFKHNLFNIYTAYKSCNKTNTVQITILSLLKTHSTICSTDKTYGKLFLAYIQQIKTSKSKIDVTELENLLETHKSPFKRLCQLAIDELKEC